MESQSRERETNRPAAMERGRPGGGNVGKEERGDGGRGKGGMDPSGLSGLRAWGCFLNYSSYYSDCDCYYFYFILFHFTILPFCSSLPRAHFHHFLRSCTSRPGPELRRMCSVNPTGEGHSDGTVLYCMAMQEPVLVLHSLLRIFHILYFTASYCRRCTGATTLRYGVYAYHFWYTSARDEASPASRTDLVQY